MVDSPGTHVELQGKRGEMGATKEVGVVGLREVPSPREVVQPQFPLWPQH